MLRLCQFCLFLFIITGPILCGQDTWCSIWAMYRLNLLRGQIYLLGEQMPTQLTCYSNPRPHPAYRNFLESQFFWESPQFLNRSTDIEEGDTRPCAILIPAWGLNWRCSGLSRNKNNRGSSGATVVWNHYLLIFLIKMSYFTLPCLQNVGNPVQIINYVELSRFRPILKRKVTFV